MKEAPFLIFFVLLTTSKAKPQGGYNYPQHQQQLQLPQHTNQISGVFQQQHFNGNQLQTLPQAPSFSAPAISPAPLPQANPPLQQSSLHILPVTHQISQQFVQPLRQPDVFLPAPGTHFLSQQEQFAGPSQLIQGQPQGAQLDIPQLPIQPNQILIPNLQAPQVQHGFSAPAQPTVTKDIYVHVAPEESPVSPQNIPPPPPPKKHYRIIFIKSPSQNIRQQQVIHTVPPTAAVEEKTLIYVLVKKPQHDEVRPPAPVQPSKPEVYFIKYKAKPGADVGTVNSQLLADNNNNLKNEQNPVQLINSGESSSSLISGGLPAEGTKYGPPGYQKRSV